MNQDIRSAIRQFVGENLLYRVSVDTLTDDASFIEGGMIDSTGILHLVTFLEEHFGIRVADSEVVPENLDSIARIAKYVGSKTENPKLGESHAA